jgi:hypothetical protein
MRSRPNLVQKIVQRYRRSALTEGVAQAVRRDHGGLRVWGGGAR